MDDLLDNGFKNDWNWINGDFGRILWYDKPNIGLMEAFLSSDRGPNRYSGSMTGIGVIWVIMFFYLIVQVKNGHYLYAFILGFFTLILPLVKDLLFYYKTSKTEYAITRNYVFFKLFNGWKYKIHSIHMSEIIAVNLVLNDTDRGTLHIVTEDEVEFKSYDTITRKKRDHSTFESVRNAEKALKIIKQKIKKYPSRTIKYIPPVLSDWQLQSFQALLLGVLAIYVYIGYKIFLFPLWDTGESMGFSVILYFVCMITLVLSFIRTLKDKTLKVDVVYPIIGINLWMILICFLLMIFINS